ncbi:hypothetical protein PS723_06668 [Pseudomonas fluorescens]|uniref:Uncharacterized protein n=1 Tax=Pseudomonas fluorescens TaxID=294 RepID=A0A5E7G916_PSEFL|nr:hypothetical protein PS723_06668 [Pseudomonas fluorescens]
MPDATIWVKASQTMVEMPRLLALMPLLAHGDTAEKPSPKPSTTSTSDNAAAATAPANIAAQDTAEWLLDSSSAVR